MKKTVLKSITFVLVLVMALGVFAGCGGGASDEDQIKNVVSKFESALKSGDVFGVLECVDPDTQKEFNAELEAAAKMLGMSLDEFKKSDYVQSMLGGVFDEYADAKVTAENIKVDGDTATADLTLTLNGENDTEEGVKFVKAGGAWYLDGDEIF